MSAGKNQNRVRIIGGIWRGRHVQFADAPGLRPTGDRLRETLFNWLQNQVAGSQCLDLFAGSGALGFEAASRGAASVTLIESNRAVCRQLQQQVTEFTASDRMQVKCEDAVAFIQQDSPPPQTYDLVFVDPPFADEQHQSLLQQLCTSSLLAPRAMIYLEMARSPASEGKAPSPKPVRPKSSAGESSGSKSKSAGSESLLEAVVPAGWHIHKAKVAGNVVCGLLKAAD